MSFGTQTPLILPIELVPNVTKFIYEPRELLRLMTVNRYFFKLARRSLYSSVDLNLDRQRFHSCMQALNSSNELAELVLSVRVEWDNQDLSGPLPITLTDEEGVKLKCCLKRLRNLRSLTLNLTLFDRAKPLNDIFPFKLTRFSTTLPCDDDLLTFLNTQKTLQDLRIDSGIDSPDSPKLQVMTLPDLRILRWGKEQNLDPAALEIMRRVSVIQEIHVTFLELNMVKKELCEMRNTPCYLMINKACFTLHFPALSLVSDGQLPNLKHLSLRDSIGNPGCFHDLKKLRLNNYPNLRTLSFLWTMITWNCFIDSGQLDSYAHRWFKECPKLESITFKTRSKGSAGRCHLKTLKRSNSLST